MNSEAATNMNDNNNAAALVTTLEVCHGSEKAFAEWHARMSTAPSDFAGFTRAEIRAPDSPGDARWSVIQRFRSLQELRVWQSSDVHEKLLAEAGSITGINGDGRLTGVETVELQSDSTVTEAIATFVKPGFETAYRDWAATIHAVEAQFPGYQGGSLQPPASKQQSYWTTLVHFATPEQLDIWLASAERKKLLEQHEALVESWTASRLPASFAGWFPSEAGGREGSTALKQSMLVLLVLFPIVMAELRFLGPRLTGLPPAIATFIGNAISVGLIAWPFMPVAILCLNWWLSPKKTARGPLRVGGYALLFILYAAEIAALWKLL